MADKGIGVGNCPDHGDYYLDAQDSPCPSCEDGGLAVYQIQIIDEIKASSPRHALRVFLSRLRDEETAACVEHLQSGEKYVIECQTGECLSMKL